MQGTQMKGALEKIYQQHHALKRSSGFVLLGDERGSFLKKNIGENKKVLDVGCRDGALTSYYAENNDVTGLDIDTHALQRAHELLGIKTKHVDLNGDWGVPENTFDVVVAAEVVEHLYNPEVVIEKIAAVLKADGVALVTIPNAFSLMNRVRYMLKQKKHTPLGDPTHINHFTVEEFTQLLSERFNSVQLEGLGRLGFWARTFPQLFSFDLCYMAQGPKKA